MQYVGHFGTGPPAEIGEPREILKFLEYHVCPQRAGQDHEPSILSASRALFCLENVDEVDPLAIEDFDWANPPFVRGIRFLVHSHHPVDIGGHTARLVPLMWERWFDCSVHIVEPKTVGNRYFTLIRRCYHFG